MATKLAAASSTTAAAVDAESTSDSTDSSADAATAETVRFVDENKAERMAKAFRSLYETKQFADVGYFCWSVWTLSKCLLSAANLLQLPSLKAACAEYMRRHVTKANCLPVYFFADPTARLSRICSQDEFLSLPADRLAEIIRDDFLCVQSEEAYVRFACMSCYYLCDRVECEPMLQADSKVQETAQAGPLSSHAAESSSEN
uniref:BACK domain-containing protein n=1 Tax=Macrostomum lignano TaxID=282301 RepID=A0A1I8FGJ3_9PLAT